MMPYTEKTAVLLLNTGTPAKAEIASVRRYLSEFLGDKRIIGGPWLFRKMLVNLIIVPFRVRKSTRIYKRLWTPEGSPLLVNGLLLQKKVQEKLGDKYLVKLAMNYGEPGIRRILKEAVSEKMIRIIPFPLYPQYASSTTGSALEKILKILSGEKTVPAISSVLQYYNDPLYIKAMAARIAMFDLDLYDHIVISFHGLPLSHVRACHEGKSCDDFNCISEVNRHNRYCYHATCYATARQLVREIQIDERKYTVCFQSRIARNWLRPFADETIQMLAKEGKKKLLFICPSFTSDCLETIVEVGYEYRELFLGLGGEKLDLVPSLNDSEAWVEAVRQIILSHSPESTP